MLLHLDAIEKIKPYVASNSEELRIVALDASGAAKVVAHQESKPSSGAT